MNLHGIVRGAINSVNADKPALFLASLGATSNADYSQTPAYAPGVAVVVQIQPLGKDELKHVDRLNLQGTFRTCYLFSNPQQIVRVNSQGGDLLQFAPFQGQAVQNWKVVGPVEGPWDVNNGGWTKLIICLQTDTPTVIPGTGP
jgi:hypothetical protein